MALLDPIIHCLVDREPATFHAKESTNPTVPFAVNLSFEVPSDGVEADLAADEAAAETKFLDFLSALKDVEFHVYLVDGMTPATPGSPPIFAKMKLQYITAIGRVSETDPLGHPGDLYGWLKEQRFTTPRYWSTKETWDPKVAVDVDAAGAAHRLRAAQGWNAPVGHKFALTHVLRIPETIVGANDIVVLPYFKATGAVPTVEGEAADYEATAFDFKYDTLGLGLAACRTIDVKMVTGDLDLPKIDPALDPSGYLKIDKEVAITHRLLTWFETRAASLIAVNGALNSRKTDAEKDEAFEAMFGLQTVTGVPPASDTLHWGSLVWFIVARLLSTLDNLVIGTLKPVGASIATHPFDSSEGDILAPLVTLLREGFDSIADKANLNDAVRATGEITTALRLAIATASSLTALPSIPPMPAKTNAALVQVLRRVYGIDAPKTGSPTPKVEDARELIAEALERYAAIAGGTELPERARDYAASIAGKSAAIVARALLDLEQPLQEEAGAEAAILKMIDSAQRPGGPSVANQIAAAYLVKIKHPAPTNVLPLVEAEVDRALTAYRTLLDSPFNGAEATRRASSSAFVRNLLDFSGLPVAGKPSSEVLATNITTSAFYSKRLGVGVVSAPAACFDPLIAALAMPDKTFLLAKPDDVRVHLEAGFEGAIAPLAAVNDPNARFIPDSTPQPLAIQIASNIDGSRIDQFAKYFNGIAVAIRRRDGGASDRWAHAHIADLDWTPKNAAPIVPPPARDAKAALHPMLPAISDGRGAMFIEYEGFPFADAASDARIVDNEEESQEEREKRELFYRHGPHEPMYGPGGSTAPPLFAQAPRLAYGRWFDTFSFVTTNAGTLPLALQRKADPPTTDPSLWMPDHTIQEPDATLVANAPYQRRTAIAQMAVVEDVMGAQPRRIGAPIAGVMPLAADYPRIGLKATNDAPAVHDIFRESDGSGRMIVGEVKDTSQQPTSVEWRISDMRYSGTPSKLVLRFFTQHAKTGDSGKEFTIDQTTVPGFASLKEIVVRIVHVAAPVPVPPPPPPVVPTYERRLQIICDGKVCDEKPLPGTGALEGWLRLRLEAGSQPVTLTFADPGEQKTDNVAAPLLLLAPGASAPWKRGLADPVTTTISTPRIGYLDFERWFANRDLFVKTFTVQPEDDTRAAGFMKALLVAYMMRHLHPRIAELINRLPDPAVEAVRLELTALDRLSNAEPGAVTAQTHLLAGKLKEFANKLVPEDHWTVTKLVHKLLEPLNALFQFKVRLAPGALSLPDPEVEEDKPVRFSASVPEGVVARLSIDALVPAGHFAPVPGTSHPAVFHDGLTQYAPRAIGKMLAFPAAAVRIETLYDDRELLARPRGDNGEPKENFNELAVALAARMITAEGVERARRFDLMSASALPPIVGEQGVVREALTRRWRVLGEIDATTQRFRSGGRPIYHYVNPREHRYDGGRADAAVRHPALPLKFNDDDLKLAQFELEAFFDRPDVDAHTVTQRLDPLGSRTRLQEHHWNSESASYFRHRFTLRSRYAGALTQADRREVNAWPADNLATTAHGWTHRVAMLADLARVLLTRPQLRALIPLTTAPGGEDTREPAPPVAGILQEPPFGRGGLADRTAAEIKTGFGYGFESATAKHVEILDSRKEGGTDPHLDYRPLDAETARGLVLRAEGPIGLTFDNVNAPAPALPNAMILLKPDTLFRSEALNGSRVNFEEFFTGVVLRRYIDPNWTTSGLEPDKPLDGERCWWIDVTAASKGEHKVLEYTVEGDSEARMLLTVKIDEKRVTMITSKRTVDGIGSTANDMDLVEIALIERTKFDGLSILHQPIAPGLYATAVFARAQSARTERGEANLPLLVTSFEWSPNKPGSSGPDDKQPVVKIIRPTGDHAYATMASAPTFLKWTRTGRDFDFVHLAFDEHGQWQPQRRHVREIVADLSPDHEFVKFRRNGTDKSTWLLPSTSTNPYPLHLHRHLGLITSRFLKELGSPAEIFCRTSADPKLEHQLVNQKGTLRDPENKDEIFRPHEQIVRVVEFETPAAILTSASAPAVPQTYKQAYFDLVATGFKLSAEAEGKRQGHLRLYFRFVGSPAHVRAFNEITLELWRAAELPQGQPRPTDKHKLRVKLDNSSNDVHTLGLELILQRNGKDADPTTAIVRLLRSNAKFESVTPTATGAPLFTLADASKNNTGFFVAIAGVQGGSEFWTDVSLLHSPRALPTSPLDLGWLFSSTTGGEPASLVGPAGLNAMVEAQARVVTVSPPIPIVRH